MEIEILKWLIGNMIMRSWRFQTPIVFVGLAFVLALYGLFSSSMVALISIVTTGAIVVFWRRFVLRTVSSDYNVRLETATDLIRMSAAKWSAVIFAVTYFGALVGCGLGYFLGGSWNTFALIVLFVGWTSRLPLIVAATDWELHRTDTYQS
jgi:hypothetical protein